MKILKGNYGECRFCDNMDETYGLPSLEEKSWDLCLTDPPYNINHKVKREVDSFSYDDNMEPEKYFEFSKKWYSIIKEITNLIVFTGGYMNHAMWYRIEPDLQYMIYYNIRGQGGHRHARFRKFEPLFIFGESRKGPMFAVYDIAYTIHKQLKVKQILHSCAKDWEFWGQIIIDFNPTSVIDPFLGSGTTAQVCEHLGIPWLGYEIMEEYAPDIEKRIKKGITEHSRYRPQKKQSQLSLESFQTLSKKRC